MSPLNDPVGAGWVVTAARVGVIHVVGLVGLLDGVIAIADSYPSSGQGIRVGVPMATLGGSVAAK